MSRISAFKACLLLVFFAANASGGERQLFPEAIGSQRLFYDSGAAWIVSPGPIEVDAALSAADTSSVWFGIVVHNYKNVPVTVREQDISANFGASKLRVWSASELIDQQHRKGNWRKVFAGLAAGLNAYSAGQSGRYSTSGTFDGTVHSYGSAGYQDSAFRGNYTASGIDPVAQQRAMETATRQNQALVAHVQQQGELDEQSLNAFVLHSQTILPGGFVSGHVKIDVPGKSSEPKPLVVMVSVDDQAFAFFVGLDGPYSEVQRGQAGEIYAMLEPNGTPSQLGSSNSASSEPTSPDATDTSVAFNTRPSNEPPEPAPKNAASSIGKRRPKVGDSDYWPTLEIKEKTKDRSSQSSQPPAIAVATPVMTPPTAKNSSAPRTNFVVSVIGKRLEPCPSDVANTCVVIDISWQQESAALLNASRSGRLVLNPVDGHESELGIEWQVPDELVPGSAIEQRGIEFPLGKAGAAKQWLSTLGPDSIRASFVSSNNN